MPEKWNYYEKYGRYNRIVGIMECPKCVKTITWRMYNEFMKGIRFCPWCGERLEGYTIRDRIEDSDEESY